MPSGDSVRCSNCGTRMSRSARLERAVLRDVARSGSGWFLVDSRGSRRVSRREAERWLARLGLTAADIDDPQRRKTRSRARR